MVVVVAVAGGSHGLGRAIVDALNADDRYEPVVLSRSVGILLASCYNLISCSRRPNLIWKKKSVPVFSPPTTPMSTLLQHS
jgi:hypothetical protein